MTKDKKSGWAASMAAGARHEISAGKSAGTLHDRFAAAEALASGSTPPRAVVDGPAVWLPLEQIRVRDDAVRPVHEAHALDLALSIAAVGLIHFPVVNANNELLAGGQRRAAIELLQAFASMTDADIRRMYAAFAEPGDDVDGQPGLTDEQVALLKHAWGRHFARGVPVHRIDTNALPVQAQALTIESIENEKRLDFSKADLAVIVDKLKTAGFRDRAGRPRAGERTLASELEAITGKSRRTVFRLLEDLRAEPTSTPAERGPSETSRALARQLAEHFALPVRVSDNPKKRGQGAIVIRYTSFQERAEALRKLGLRD
jgi:hypothetical protein